MLDSSRRELVAAMPTARSGARTLDVAKGILVALRQRDADDIFTELIQVGEKYAVSPFALATALVAVASGGVDIRGINAAAANAVEQEWGSLFPGG